MIISIYDGHLLVERVMRWICSRQRQHIIPSNLLDQLNLKAFLQHMSESERESANSLTDHSDETFRHLHPQQKTKHIKRDKQAQPPNHLKLTKEERIKLQKEKNREAAQRSRDQHKEYVSNLEKEVRDLKAQMECSRQLCFRCRQELNNGYDEAILKKEELLGDPIFAEISYPAEQPAEQHESILSPEEDVADYFLRVKKEEEEDYSYIKMMLFVAMVVIAVIIIPAQPQGRKLVEIYQTQSQSPKYPHTINLQAPSSINSPAQNAGNAFGQAINDQKCVSSLINNGQPQLNLRADSFLVSGGALFCTYRQVSTMYSPENELLRVFLMGKQIEQMAISGSSMKGLIKQRLQAEGIYELAAEVRSMELATHHNCRL